MPRFLDLYLEKLRDKRESLEKLLLLSRDSLELYQDLFRKYWRLLPQTEEFKGEVIAVDSSDGVIEHKEGVVIHICRALALSNRGIEERELEITPFYPTDNVGLTVFRSRMREHLEHILALKCLRKISSGDNSVILIDGSLYGRMAHLPKDSEIPGYQGFMLDYIRVYSELFEEAQEKNVLVIGLSKDSKSRIYKRVLLFEELTKKIGESSLGGEISCQIIEAWNALWKNPKQSLEKLKSIKGVPPWVKEMLREALAPRPDIQLITRLIDKPGYTVPALLKTPAPALDSLVNAIEKGELRKYIERSFSNAIAEAESVVYKKALKILPRILQYPDIVMFYYLPKKGDIPIRVDAPAWILGDNVKTSSRFAILEGFENRLEQLLSLLNQLYAGPRHYNVLMEDVDSKVKLRMSDILKIYEPILSKELDFLIEHTRDVRRVRYP